MATIPIRRKNVKIEILCDQKELQVHIEDQGVGFDYC